MPSATGQLSWAVGEAAQPEIGSRARIRTHPADAFGLADDVQTIVHAVDEVDVCVAWFAENDAGFEG